MKRLVVMMRNELMILTRDPAVIFWVFVFPFFFLFTLLFSFGSDGKLPTQTIEIVDLDGTPMSERYIDLVKNAFTAKESLPGLFKPGDPTRPIAPGAIRVTLPQDFGAQIQDGRPVSVHLEYTRDDIPSQMSVRVMHALSIRFNADVARAPMAVDVVADGHGAEPAIAYSHYALTGVMVLSMMSAGMLSTCMAIAYRRERNGFKMLACLPLSASSFLSAMLLARMVTLLAGAFVLLLCAGAVFGIHVDLDATRLARAGAIFVLGGVMLLALGSAMASRLATVSAATFVANLTYVALLFLSDLTMPLTAMSAPVREVMSWLPTAQFVAALRHVLVWGQDLGQQGPQVLGMLAWTAAFALIATLTFRWHRQ